jgi:hypothetical protein
VFGFSVRFPSRERQFFAIGPSFALCTIGCRRWPKFIEVVSGCGPANSIQRRRPPFCRRRDRRRQLRPYVIATPMACSLIAVCPAIVNVIV